MDNKIQNKKWLITYVGVALVLAVGVMTYLSQGETDEDSFPVLSYESGSTFKGYFADPGNYWQYETGDNCEHPTELDQTTLSSGLNYYYVTEDLTVQEIVDRINCVPQNRIRILYKDPKTQTFYSWPKKAHNETEELTDPTSLTIKANTAFMIDSKDQTHMGEIYNVNVPLPPAPVLSPAINPFNTGGPYEFVNDMTSGWVGIVGTIEGTQFSDDLNTSDVADRVEQVFSKNGVSANAFQDVAFTSGGAVGDIDFSAEEYMVWLKLGAEPELPIIVIGDPPVELVDVCENGLSGVCMTKVVNSEIKIKDAQTQGYGTAACMEVVETGCINVEEWCPDANNEFIGGWGAPQSNTSAGFCSYYFDPTEEWDCLYRANCEMPQLNTAYDVIYYVPLFLDPNIIDMTDQDPSGLGNAIEGMTTGNVACSNIGKECSKIETNYDAVDGTSNGWVDSSQYVSCLSDMSVSADSDSEKEGLQVYGWFRAKCGDDLGADPCDSTPNGYTCITDPSGLPLFETGEELCQSLSPDKHCLGLSSYDTTTETWNKIDEACGTWSLGLGSTNDPYAVMCSENLLPCGGNDDMHVCMTSDSFNQYFRWTGDEACSYIGETCTRIEEYNTIANPWMSSTDNFECDDDSGSILLTTKTLRADCGSTPDCGNDDPDFACVTDQGNPVSLILNGDDACDAIGLECTGVQFSQHNTDGGDPDWGATVGSNFCDNTDFGINVAVRAECF
jgi:hypothetical protein